VVSVAVVGDSVRVAVAVAAAGVPVAVAVGAPVDGAVTVSGDVGDVVGVGSSSVGVGVGVSFSWAVSLAGVIACQPSTSAMSAANRIAVKVACRCLTLMVPWVA
jgi:hypothetical protein